MGNLGLNLLDAEPDVLKQLVVLQGRKTRRKTGIKDGTGGDTESHNRYTDVVFLGHRMQ